MKVVSRPRSRTGSLLRLGLGLFFLSLSPGLTQEGAPTPAPAATEPAPPAIDAQAPGSDATAPVAIDRSPRTLARWNREIVIFRSTTTTLTPADRVEEAERNLDHVADALLETPVTAESVEVEGEPGYRFSVGEDYLFSLVASDLDELAGQELDEARDEVIARLAEVTAARLEQRSAAALLRGAIHTLVATLILVAALFLIRLLNRRVGRGIVFLVKRKKRWRIANIDIRSHVATLVEHLVQIIAFLIGVNLFCLWIAYVFDQFPLTAPLGQAFREQLNHFGADLFGGIAASIPGLITVAIIILLTRWLTRLVNRIIQGLGKTEDEAHAPMSADTAKATRRIATVVIWLFSLVLIYPYLPGSGSKAFQGVSVLLGLMVSLGSTGLVNQVMSGFVMLYSGSVRTGEYAKIGKLEGTITEMGMLAVKLLTPQREYITVPNAVMINSPMTNYSRLKDETGVALSTQVTIGYDTPWRQVHDLLTDAAEDTEEILEDPPPRVLQRALSDWYVEYTLVCYIANPEHRTAVLSRLHGRVQDGFNEAGVQIMSPHYRDQPDEAIVVPKNRWFPGADSNTTSP